MKPFCLAIFLFCWAGAAWGQSPDSIARQLGSPDAAVVQKGIADLRVLFDAKPEQALAFLQKDGLALLLRAHRGNEAAELALRGELTDLTDAGRLAALQRWRTLALLQAGHPLQALEAAKGLFNVAPMENTDRAILLLAQALQAAHPDQVDLVERFQAEQRAGASTRPSDNPTTRPGPIMAALHVDPAPYASAIASNDPDRYVINSHEYRDLVNRGNLLLLADRGDEALQNYQRMARMAGDDRQKAQANDGIARALKAQASAIGPANRWIIRLGGAH